MDDYASSLREIISKRSVSLKKLEFLLPKRAKRKKFSASENLKLKRLKKLEEDFLLNNLKPNFKKIKSCEEYEKN